MRWSAMLGGLALVACDHDDHGAHGDMMYAFPPVLAVAPGEGGFTPVVAVDLDPAPDRVEVALEARVAEVDLGAGFKASLWTYDGTLPGPRIEANVGDKVLIRFKNSLPEATTIHWHGLRVPADQDGVPVAHAPVAPGAEQVYEFVVPDAGTFWYHPHVRSDEQVERGLYGAFVVRGAAEPAATSEHTVVLDDILLAADGTLAPFDTQMAMPGRQGNLLLANGRARPILELAAGGLHRLRFINAANARYFRVTLPGTAFQIGTDGGLLAAPRPLTELLLVPGERADLLVTPTGAPGDVIDVRALRHDRGHGTHLVGDADLFQVRLAAAAVDPPAVPATLAPVADLPAPTVERRFELEESMGANGAHAHHSGVTFSINGETFPDVAPLQAELGAVERWTLVNTTPMDHPFHLHGFRFQIETLEGVAPGFAAWRDTVNVPADQTLVLRVHLADHPGTWMFHCHILEHAERGMAGLIEVVGAEPVPEVDPHMGH